jgi:hypothetical protein
MLLHLRMLNYFGPLPELERESSTISSFLIQSISDHWRQYRECWGHCCIEQHLFANEKTPRNRHTPAIRGTEREASTQNDVLGHILFTVHASVSTWHISAHVHI